MQPFPFEIKNRVFCLHSGGRTEAFSLMMVAIQVRYPCPPGEGSLVWLWLENFAPKYPPVRLCLLSSSLWLRAQHHRFWPNQQFPPCQDPSVIPLASGQSYWGLWAPSSFSFLQHLISRLTGSVCKCLCAHGNKSDSTAERRRDFWQECKRMTLKITATCTESVSILLLGKCVCVPVHGPGYYEAVCWMCALLLAAMNLEVSFTPSLCFSRHLAFSLTYAFREYWIWKQQFLSVAWSLVFPRSHCGSMLVD